MLEGWDWWDGGKWIHSIVQKHRFRFHFPTPIAQVNMGLPSWNYHQFSSINPSPYCSAFSFHKSRFSFVTFRTPSMSPNYQLASHLAACNWILIKETPWRMAFFFTCPEVLGSRSAQKQPAALPVPVTLLTPAVIISSWTHGYLNTSAWRMTNLAEGRE